MFGVYRYILALMVMIAHLAPAEWLHLGIYAVTGFFTLSGYLMALVLDTHYAAIDDGWKKYALNRFLRVMPAYWVVLCLSIVVVAAYPEMSVAVHQRMQMPQSWVEWLNQLTVVGITGIRGDVSPENLVPPAWSLSIEWIYWILMPALLLTPRRYRSWGIIAMVYTAVMVIWHAPLQLRYYALPAGAMPFFLGAYLYREGRAHPPAPLWKGVGMIVLTLAYYFGAPWLFSDARYVTDARPESDVLFAGLYVAMLLNAATIHVLSRLQVRSARIISVDKGLGHLAYPIFLLHTLAAVLVAVYFGFGCDQVSCHHDSRLFWATLPCVHIIALLLWLLVERPLIAVRRKVRR